MIARLRGGLINFLRRYLGPSEGEKGQSIIVLAFAFVGLIAALGLALDLGLVYIERVRLKRAIDAAVLSGVVELPFEEDAAARAMEYLQRNGYDLTDAQIVIHGCVRDVRDYYNLGPALCADPAPGCGDGDTGQLINAGGANFPPYTYTTPADPTSYFIIDTYNYQGEDHVSACDDSGASPAYGAANKIAITGTVYVDMNFMKLLGRPAVPVIDSAVAQNVDNLDVVVVFDESGSMGYDPVCYRCWNRTETAGPHAGDTPPYSGYYTYPDNGTAYNLYITDTNVAEACADTPHADDTYYATGGDKYIIIEAELYSANNSVVDTAFRETGKGYWAIQRGDTAGSASTGTSVDSSGMHVSHHPEMTFYEGHAYGQFYSLGDAQTGNAPRLSYDFSFFHPSAGWGSSNAYVWVRVRQGPNTATDDNGVPNRNTMYWRIEDLTQPSNSTAIYQNNDAGGGWTWVRLDEEPDVLDNKSHAYRLHIWAGSSGYDIDRILVTDNTTTNSNNLGNARTHAVTAGSAARAACDACNPIYGLTVGPGTSVPTCDFFTTPISPTNNLLNPIWGDDEAPMRVSKEAVKAFIHRLDPQYDQVGLVAYTTSSDKETELECIKEYGLDACAKGTNPISFTNVLRAVEGVSPQIYTNSADGMKDGLEVLGFDPYNSGGNSNSNGRGGAASKVMILLTDGVPNRNPGGTCSSGWYPNSSHPNRINTDYSGGGADYDCMLWFAEYARDHGVVVYVIGLGYGVDSDLLKEVAERGNGQYYFSASGGDLDFIFGEILKNIYVRLVR